MIFVCSITGSSGGGGGGGWGGRGGGEEKCLHMYNGEKMKGLDYF